MSTSVFEMDRERRHDLLAEYLRPVLAVVVSSSLLTWELGFSMLGRRVLGLGLMVYALLSLYERALRHSLFGRE